MPTVARVTTTASNLASQPRPAWHPQVVITPERADTTLDGYSVIPEPVPMFNDEYSSGPDELRINLITSDQFATPMRYRVHVDWLSPTGGTALREQMPMIVVPAGGGTLGDLALVETAWGLAWEGPTPPPTSMLWLYVDPHYDPTEAGSELPTYTTDDGAIIEHGDLVEWSA